jgi:hypothetical protein
MYAVVVISLMFGAVIVMVKRADKEVPPMQISGSSIRVKSNPVPRPVRATIGEFVHLKLIKR